MKLKRFIIFVLFFLALVAPRFSFGQACSPTALNSSDTNASQICNPVEKVGGGTLQTFAIHILQGFAGASSMITITYVVYSGFHFLISQGNSEDVEHAKRALQWSLSGLAVMMLAYVLVSALSTFLNYNPDSSIGNGQTPTVTNPIGGNGGVNVFNDLFVRIINGFLGLAGLLAILIIVLNGLRYVTAGGNDEQTEKAKSGLLYSVVGLVIIFFAYVIVRASAAFLGK
jgi:cytochrome bd-type quinol oxidase subunit 2